MAGIDFREVRVLVTMEEVLALLGFVPWSRSGPQLRGRCPLHAGSSAAKSRPFSANLVQHSFQCFKCGAAGNHLDLWALATGQSVYHAALDLCNKLNREVPRLVQGTEKRYYERAAGNKTGSLMLSSKWKQNPSGFYKELEHDSDPQQQGYHTNRRSVFGF
jgi:DNA primase